MKKYDPTKFSMETAIGVKAEGDLKGPDVMVPFCKEHRTWPCRYCGTSHFEGCTCPVCMEPKPDSLDDVREAAGYAASMLRGMSSHWRKGNERRIADDIDRYAELLGKFSKGDL